MALNTEALMDKLFRWKTTVDIEGTTLYIRIVSDQVIDDARRIALLEARKLRRELRNPNTDDYLIYIDPLQDLDDDELRNLITSVAMRTVMRDYLNTNPRPRLTELGDNPTQAEQEEFEAEKESREAVYLKDMEEYVENWRSRFVETLNKRDHDYLFNFARNNRVDQVCEERFSEIFEEHVIAASIYEDAKYKNRVFTVEQFKQLPLEVRQKIRDAYNSMNIGADDIKN